LIAGCTLRDADWALSHTIARYRTAYSETEMKAIEAKMQNLSFPVEMEAMIRTPGIPVTSCMGQYTTIDDGDLQRRVLKGGTRHTGSNTNSVQTTTTRDR